MVEPKSGFPNVRCTACCKEFCPAPRSTFTGKWFHLLSAGTARCLPKDHRSGPLYAGRQSSCHTFCVEASVVGLCTQNLWHALFQVPPGDIQTLRERDVTIAGGLRLSTCSWNAKSLMVWAWMPSYALETRTLLWSGHGCSAGRMLLEHERSYGLGLDALVTACSWNTNVIMVWGLKYKAFKTCWVMNDDVSKNHGRPRRL